MPNRQFLSWADRASAGERADAARDLARAFLYAELDPIEQGAMERAMTCLLDDSSPLVRRALAETVAGAAHVPRHIVSALANDQADIAAIILARSPILTDAELIDAAALGETPIQTAIAARPGLSAGVAGAVAEIGSRDAVLILCRNGSATLAEVSLRRILERFDGDATLREALGARPDLPAALRHALVVAAAEALRRFVTDCRWMAPERARRVAEEASARAAVTLAASEDERDGSPGRIRFAAHLRRAGHLTPALLLRALMSGETALFEAALAELSGQSPSRVAALVRHHDGLAFAALVRAAGLPESLLPAIRAALALDRRAAREAAPLLRREVVAEVLVRCGLDRISPLAGLAGLLRRFEAEAARDESRAGSIARRAVASPARAPHRIEPRFDPVLDLAVAA